MNSIKGSFGLKHFIIGGAAALIVSLAVPSSAVLREDTNKPNAYLSEEAEVSDRIIVKYHEQSSGFSAQASTELSSKMSKRAKRRMKKLRRMYNGDYVMKFDKKMSRGEMDTVISELLKEPGVESATIDTLMYPMFEPNDQYYGYQWHYFEPTGGLNLPDAWDISTGSGVVVAVLDTGYRPHVDLVGNIVGGYDMVSDPTMANDGGGRDSDASDPGDACESLDTDSSWHGTHVAGTIAAVTDNGTGVAGVAYGSKILPVRVLGACGGYLSDIADGIIWAAGGSVSGVPNNPYPAEVINMSLGGQASCDSVTQAAINTARSLGSTLVVAAGNSELNAANFSPASCDGVITVAATNRSGGRADYSNYGSVVDVAAPGGEMTSSAYDGILSTIDSGTTSPSGDAYWFNQGTSMAAPHVAGVAALLYAVDPAITPDEVEAILKQTSREFPGYCSQCGEGIVDATAALQAVVGSPSLTTGESGLANGVAETGIYGSYNSETFYTMNVPAGASGLSFTISGGSGDADLYVRYGNEPTMSSYDCRPFQTGNAETCSFSAPSAGTYHIMIHAYEAYSGLSLVGSYY